MCIRDRINARGFPETKFTLQVYEEDCTGCKLCYEACPVIDQESEELRAINILPKNPDLKKHRKVISYFEKLPIHDKNMVNYSTVHGVQFLDCLLYTSRCV